MPNEIRTTKKATLDNLCLTPVKGISSTLYNTEFLRAMERIRQKDLEKKRAFYAYLDRYEQDATQAAHLKSLVAFQRRNAPSKTMRTCTTTPIACIRSTAEDLTPITLKVNTLTACQGSIDAKTLCVPCVHAPGRGSGRTGFDRASKGHPIRGWRFCSLH